MKVKNNATWVIIFTLIQTVFDLQFELNRKAQSSALPGDSNLRLLLEKEMSAVSNNLWTINMCIGEPQQCFHMLYDIGSHFTWVGSRELIPQVSRIYNPSKSKTCSMSSTKEKILNHEMTGVEFKEYFHFNSDQNSIAKPLFCLFLVGQVNTVERFSYEGVLGLNRKYSSSTFRIEKNVWIEGRIEYSFLDYLFKNNVINQQVFAHKMYKSKKGVVYFGEAGTTEVNYPKCNSQTPQYFEGSFFTNYWHCRSTNIFDDSYNQKIIPDYQNLMVIFDSGLDLILGPEREMGTIFQYIQNHSKKASCKTEMNEDIAELLKCYDLDLSSVPQIAFQIEHKVNLTFKGEDLFAKESQRDGKQIFKSKIGINRYLKHSLVFGVLALERYHMIFNKQEETIGFLPLEEEEILIENALEVKANLKLVMKSFLIMMISLVGLEIIFMLKNKKSIMSKEKALIKI